MLLLESIILYSFSCHRDKSKYQSPVQLLEIMINTSPSPVVSRSKERSLIKVVEHRHEVSKFDTVFEMRSWCVQSKIAGKVK